MTLNEVVLQKLADWRPAGNERQSLAIAEEGTGWSVQLSANRNDVLGCLAWEIIVRRMAVPAPPGLDLAGWADGIARRVTGLLESLRVVEVDVPRNEALLRSDQPTQRGQAVIY